MPNPTSLLVATALVAIPSTAGIYHLATSSSSSKTVEQEELNKEGQAQELAPAKDPVIEEETSELLPDAPSLDSVSAQVKEPKREIKDVVGAAKLALSDLSTQFPYYLIEAEKGARTNQFEVFVGETDKIRDSITKVITTLINQKEHENKDIKDLADNVLGFELIDSTRNDELWSKLAQIRKEEAGAQTDIDNGGLSKRGYDPEGNDVTKDNIVDFCLNPSEANSHLGMYSAKRKTQEETKEYRLFTYYSYCTKNSFYLNDQLVFEEEVQ